MHKVSVVELEPGMQLGRNLYNHRGDILLAHSTNLNPAFIASIRERGYHFVYIFDGIADDVEPVGLISQRLRSATVRNLDGMFQLMATATRPILDEAAEEGAHVLRDVPVKLTTAVDRQIKRLEGDVEQLLDEAFDAQMLDGVASLKSHDNYTFEHSGTRTGLRRTRAGTRGIQAIPGRGSRSRTRSRPGRRSCAHRSGSRSCRCACSRAAPRR
jgi:hypothetical protein